MKSFKSVPNPKVLLLSVLSLGACQPTLDPTVQITASHSVFEADGRLSEAEQTIPTAVFQERFDFGESGVEPLDITYRLAYSDTHLYVAIETDANDLIYRNRGFLWGDGWRLLLALPESDKDRTSRYSDVWVSPKAPGNDQPEIFLAVRDNQQVYQRFSDQTVAAESHTETGTLFEAEIAWADIPPFHPAFTPDVGVNLYFAKAYETESVGEFAIGHAIVPDEGIWDEEIQTRAFAPAIFDARPLPLVPKTVLNLEDRTISVGDPISLEVVTRAPEAGNSDIHIKISNRNQSFVHSETKELFFERGETKTRIELRDLSLPPGSYEIDIAGIAHPYRAGFNVLPALNFTEAIAQIETDTAFLPLGDQQTMQFRLETLQAKIANLTNYADSRRELSDLLELVSDLETVSTGENPFESRKGPYRRAFKSEQDDTLQPYSIKLPDEFDPNTPYPALVFLHGSGRNEEGLLDLPRSNNRFVEIAPFGRDMYLAYSEDVSQKDIVEALNATSDRFLIDRERVIIGGFSMGGYGALRAFYENPHLYKGVAVFSGHPNLANEWRSGEFPNFLDAKYLSVFKDIPVFIYHGEKDAALSYDLAVELTSALESAGAIVTFSGHPDNGHVYQDEQTHARYLDWLSQF
ncbi:MAG: prolyl oligopeptidase family serine peptidase [Pseudomonadota bacterium]